MPPHTVITTMLGSLLGTVAQSMVVYGVVPLIAGPSLDGAALGGSPCALGLLLHLLSGSVLFPLGFLALPADAVPGPPVLRGMLWAGCLAVAGSPGGDRPGHLSRAALAHRGPLDDAGIRGRYVCVCACFPESNAGMIPNSKENPRNRMTTKRGRRRLCNAAIHR